ncbi:MAG: tRNA-specific adenosine deaminase, partial [Phycisphaeraceae bacterium]|nr:tRNA-specific adenosine deaminase [Phycisphaeraceae bacterium]
MSPANLDEKYMRMALDACRQGVEAGQSPFGACIVREGRVLATAHNQVWRDT